MKSRAAAPGRAPVRSLRLPAWADIPLRLAVVAYIALVAIPVRYEPIRAGLDHSWAFELNDAAAKGLVHGRDIDFTYGPLGYLTFPMDVGGNLARGLAAQIAVWLLFAATIAWVAFGRRVPLVRLALFAVLLLGGVAAFHQFGYAGVDMFLGFWTLVLLGCALDGALPPLFLVAASAVAALLALVKLSSGIQAFSAVAGFAVITLLLDGRRALPAAATALAGTPLLFAAMYLAYNPSLAGLARYVRASQELSSGFSAAMSEWVLPGGLLPLVWPVAGYLAFAGVLWWRRQRSAVLATAALGPLFLEFKHSVVRPSGHVDFIFKFLPLVVAAVLLFTEFRKEDWWAPAAALGLFLAGWSTWPHDVIRPVPPLAWTGPLRGAFRLPRTKRELAGASAAALAPDTLPPALLERISGRSVAFFPWEASYAAANKVVHRPFPVFQTYSAYTAWLDRWNAEALRADCVVLDWTSIDGRHPLLDVPALSLALYRDYQPAGNYGGHLLLERRSAPRFGSLRHIGTRTFARGDALRFERHLHPLIARVRLEPTPAGRLRRFLFQVPEVTALFWSEAGGGSMAARVPPDVLENGIPLNFTPADLEGAEALFAHDRGAAADALSFGGPGIDAYRPEITVDLYDIPDVRLDLPDPVVLPASSGLDPAVRIEWVGSRMAVESSADETLEVPAPLGFIRVLGSGAAGRAWVELDGRSYPARAEPGYQKGGFAWVVPSWRLGSGAHTLRVRVGEALSRQAVRMRIVR